jgi:hypothetical protein
MLGRMKAVDNQDARFGADPWYWFVKVQAHGRGESGEEYWLVTEEEALKFADRAERNPEDPAEHRAGVFTRVANTNPHPGANDSYVALKVKTPDKRTLTWLLTEYDLERIRERTEANNKDIEANREGWLADLFD